jgi:hypothetical protein
MRRIGYAVSFIIGAGLLGAAIAVAQPGPGRGAGRGSATRMYDPATVETLNGVVERVEQVKGMGGGGGSGIHLLLKTDKEEIPVLLGPSWYVEKQSLAFAPQDRVEVRGSRTSYEGKPAIVAAEVKKGDQVLKLRDTAGVPLWRGQGRRGR